MQSMQRLQSLPDDELLRRLAALVHESRHTEAELVAHIGEVDARRLYARAAVPSMFQYCTERLHLSGAEAYLRIAAARASREHPPILAMLADGRLHLTAVAMLAPHLTAENRDALLARATHRSKREIEELLAEVAPRPDVPALMRKLPERRASWPALGCLPISDATPSDRAGKTDTHAGTVSPSHEPPSQPLSQPPSGASSAGVPSPDPHSEQRPESLEAHRVHGSHVPATPVLRLDGVDSSGSTGSETRRCSIEPLSPGRYKVQFTASAALHAKLQRLQNLMCSSAAGGDIVAVIEAAVTEKLERLERRRFGARSPAVRSPGESASMETAAVAATTALATATSATATSATATPATATSATAAPEAAAPEAAAPANATPPARAAVAHASAAGPSSELPATARDGRVDAFPGDARAAVTGPAAPAASSRHVPAGVRRAVHDRDGDRCRYVDEQGHRCTARAGLEFHHRRPFGMGGNHSLFEMSLLCKTHNRLMAEIDYGRAAISRHAHRGRRRSN